eukprot:31191-Pelagococcus_subviridis.AAC.24
MRNHNRGREDAFARRRESAHEQPRPIRPSIYACALAESRTIGFPVAFASTIFSQRILSYSSGSMKSGSLYDRHENMWQSEHRSSDSNCRFPRHHVCVK